MQRKENIKKALLWIVGLLEEKNVPYQVSGGFAASLYGSKREIYDIDIDVPQNKIIEIGHETIRNIISGPQKITDDSFDVLLLTIEIFGVRIDISGDDGMIFNSISKKWEHCGVNFFKFEPVEFYGKIIKVIPVDELVEYKLKLGREEDLKDIELIKNAQEYKRKRSY